MVILGKGETLLSFGSLVTAGACILYIEKFKYPPLQYLHKNLFSTVSTKKMLLAYYMNSFLPTLSSVYLLREVRSCLLVSCLINYLWAEPFCVSCFLAVEVLCWFVGLLSLTNKALLSLLLLPSLARHLLAIKVFLCDVWLPDRLIFSLPVRQVSAVVQFMWCLAPCLSSCQDDSS